jgi:hypothetical protein
VTGKLRVVAFNARLEGNLKRYEGLYEMCSDMSYIEPDSPRSGSLMVVDTVFRLSHQACCASC